MSSMYIARTMTSRKPNLDGMITSLILDTVHRKFRWIGHILRHDSLLRDIIEGRMKGKATRGRKRLQMLSDVINKSYEEVER